MVITDLDGTLAREDSTICQKNIETLKLLAKKRICRVIATGRSIYSARQVLENDFPIDYLIFSSGAGIMDWKTKKIIHENHLSAAETEKIAKILIEHNTDFMLQKQIPENHNFYYHISNPGNKGFQNRFEIYKDFATPLNITKTAPGISSQFVVILPDDVNFFEELKSKFKDIKIIRATSPLGDGTIWMEIFPIDVSKGKAVQWLCNKLDINRKETMGIGNDYNDLDLLNWTEISFVVGNAPEELKKEFNTTANNSESGFTKAVRKIINL